MLDFDSLTSRHGVDDSFKQPRGESIHYSFDCLRCHCRLRIWAAHLFPSLEEGFARYQRLHLPPWLGKSLYAGRPFWDRGVGLTFLRSWLWDYLSVCGQVEHPTYSVFFFFSSKILIIYKLSPMAGVRISRHLRWTMLSFHRRYIILIILHSVSRSDYH